SVPPKILISPSAVSPALMKATMLEETLLSVTPLPARNAPVPPPPGLDAGAGSRISHRRAPPNVVDPVKVTNRNALVLSPGPLFTMAPAPPTPAPLAVIGSAPNACEFTSSVAPLATVVPVPGSPRDAPLPVANVPALIVVAPR